MANQKKNLLSKNVILYASRLAALHEIIRAGQGDSQEADALRDEMDEPWNSMGSDEIKLVNQLSADLESHSKEWPDKQQTPEMRLCLRELANLLERNQWLEALKSLHQCDHYIDRAQASYVRAKIWSGLSANEPARLFIKDAILHDSENSIYKWTEIQILLALNKLAEAIQIAEDIIDNKDRVDQLLLFTAAHVLFVLSKQVKEGKGKAILQKVIDIIEYGFAHLEKSTYKSSVQLAYIELGMSKDHLNDERGALEAFNAALDANPSSGIALIARGIQYYGRDSIKSVADFTKAISTSSSAWPHFFLAHHFVANGYYQQAIEHCNAGLELSLPDQARAQLFEWLAISKIMSSGEREEVLCLFDSALSLDPYNELARRNKDYYLRVSVIERERWLMLSQSEARQYGLNFYVPESIAA